jgi:hypothetical protein
MCARKSGVRGFNMFHALVRKLSPSGPFGPFGMSSPLVFMVWRFIAVALFQARLPYFKTRQARLQTTTKQHQVSGRTRATTLCREAQKRMRI